MMYTDEVIRITNWLPHGSGINDFWDAWQTKEYIYFQNTFYPMNKNGFYDEYTCFWIAIPKDNPQNWKLHFIGKRSQHYAKKYSLREYLEDLFSYAIGNMIEKGILK